MAKKKAKKTKKTDAERLKKQALDSAHRVWLAGLGALAVAETEGSKLFGKLVARGEEMEKRGKPVVEKLSKKVGSARAQAEAKAEQVGEDAKAAWGKVESVVEDRVSATLNRLGIPTRDEIESLTRRVEALTEKLGGAPAGKAGTTRRPRKKAAKKAARKPAKKAAKKTAKRPAKKAARRPRKAAATAAPGTGGAASEA